MGFIDFGAVHRVRDADADADEPRLANLFEYLQYYAEKYAWILIPLAVIIIMYLIYRVWYQMRKQVGGRGRCNKYYAKYIHYKSLLNKS